MEELQYKLEAQASVAADIKVRVNEKMKREGNRNQALVEAYESAITLVNTLE